MDGKLTRAWTITATPRSKNATARTKTCALPQAVFRAVFTASLYCRRRATAAESHRWQEKSWHSLHRTAGCRSGICDSHSAQIVGSSCAYSTKTERNSHTFRNLQPPLLRLKIHVCTRFRYTCTTVHCTTVQCTLYVLEYHGVHVYEHNVRTNIHTCTAYKRTCMHTTTCEHDNAVHFGLVDTKGSTLSYIHTYIHTGNRAR